MRFALFSSIAILAAFFSSCGESYKIQRTSYEDALTAKKQCICKTMNCVWKKKDKVTQIILDEKDWYSAERISLCVNLEVLRLENIGLEVPPPNLSTLKRLKSVNLSGNKLTKWPLFLESLDSLHHLNLSQNPLQGLPAKVGRHTELRYLDVLHNNIDSLPSTIGQLTELKVLRVGLNRLKAFPPQIINLQKLENLEMTNNLFTAFPSEICELRSLKTLQMGNEPTTSGYYASFDHGLSNYRNTIPFIPAEISQLQALEHLDISDCGLEIFSKEFGKLQSLRWFLATGNGFSDGDKDWLKREMPNTKFALYSSPNHASPSGR